MTRYERLLKQARARGDRLAIATLETAIANTRRRERDERASAILRGAPAWANDPEDAYLRMEVDRG